MNIKSILTKKIQETFNKIGIPKYYDPKLKISNKEKFGDYQINGVMNLSKKFNISAQILAEKIVTFIDLKDIAHKIEIIKPGFINIFLSPKWIEQQINSIILDPKLGITKVTPQTVVVDYSSPNIAKEMHIGNLRSTIIGDAIVRILSFLGNNVIKANHVGDWGTQFGMIIAYLHDKQFSIEKNIININILEELYIKAKNKYDQNPCFAEKSRNFVVKLQNGDYYSRNIWTKLVNLTLKENQKIYDRMNISLTKKNVMGESTYHHMIPQIIQDLQDKRLAKIKNGAIVVLLDKIKNKQGQKMGVVIQKKDGGYLYTTTDLACIKYRSQVLKADRIIYYTDSRQNQHLTQVWDIARQAGYVNKNISLEHHMFGMILNKDNKPFQTRVGKTIKINKLLDEAFKRAYSLVINRHIYKNKNKLNNIANTISIGAIKYNDLSKKRTTDYVFNWDNMLNFEGNTAPYILYGYVRIMSILKKNKKNDKKSINKIILQNKHEIILATCILRFEETIIQTAKEGTPHILCNYLYFLATSFSSLYEECIILKTQDLLLRQSRLQLILLTSKILKIGLNLLGIKTIKTM